MESRSNNRMLLVSNARDDEIRRFAEALRRGGSELDVCGTVYTAMARLARAADRMKVIVDIRRMDDHELRFVELAPRYHRGVRVFAADLPGARRRMARMRAALSLFSAAEGARPPVEESPPARPAPTAERAAMPSADVADTDAGPSMHEAVRQRMAGSGAAPVRRRPPSPSGEASTDTGRLSEAEMAALLEEQGGYDASHDQGREERTGDQSDSSYGARGG